MRHRLAARRCSACGRSFIFAGWAGSGRRPDVLCPVCGAANDDHLCHRERVGLALSLLMAGSRLEHAIESADGPALRHEGITGRRRTATFSTKLAPSRSGNGSSGNAGGDHSEGLLPRLRSRTTGELRINRFPDPRSDP